MGGARLCLSPHARAGAPNHLHSIHGRSPTRGHPCGNITRKSRARTLFGAVTRAVAPGGRARGARLVLLAVREPVRFLEQPAPGVSITYGVRDERLAHFDAGYQRGSGFRASGFVAGYQRLRGSGFRVSGFVAGYQQLVAGCRRLLIIKDSIRIPVNEQYHQLMIGFSVCMQGLGVRFRV